MNLLGADPSFEALFKLAEKHNVHPTSGYRPGSITSSGNISLHASRHAVDWGGDPPNMLAFAKDVRAEFGGSLDELIYKDLGDDNQIKNGKPAGRETYGDVIDQHDDHVHTGFTGKFGKLDGGGLSLGDVAKTPLTALGVPIPALGGAGDAAQNLATAPVRALVGALGIDGPRLLLETALVLGGAILVLWGLVRVTGTDARRVASTVVPAARAAKGASA